MATRLSLVNLWMIAFSTMGLWMVVALRSDTWSACTLIAVLVFAVILITGFRKSPLSLPPEPGEKPRPGMEHFGIIYLKAWRTLWREKWLLRFFGLMLLAGVLGRAVQYGLTRHYLADRFADHPPAMAILSWLYPSADFMVLIANNLTLLILDTLGAFFPSVVLSSVLGSTAIVPIAVLVFVLWSWNRFRSIAHEQNHTRDVRVIVSLLAPLAVLALLAAASIHIHMMNLYAHLSGTVAPPEPSMMAAISLPVAVIWGFVQAVFIIPVLLGGLTGSLHRTGKGEQVSSNTFLTDAAQHFRPLAGLAVIMTLAYLILHTSSSLLLPRIQPHAFLEFFTLKGLASNTIGLFLMFVPFAIVTLGLGTLEGIRNGLRVWLRHKKDAISFVALGITFVLVANTALEMIRQLVHPLSPFTFIVDVASTLISVIIAAFMLVAIWEFYRRIVDVRPEVQVAQEEVGA